MSDIQPVAGPDIEPLPWEVKESEKTPEENLFDALGSEPEFQEEEDLKDEDELEPDDDLDEVEDEDGETDDEDDLEDGDDDEVEEDEDEVDEDEEEEGSDDEDRYEVKIQGEVEEVTLQELKDGYSRTADYTRKRQEDVQEHAVEMEGVREVREKYSAHLEQLQAVMESLTPADEPDEALRTSNPGEYAAQKQDRADRIAAIDRVAAERAVVAKEKAKEDNAAQAVYLQSEMDKLSTAVEGWDNETTRTAALAELRTFAMEEFNFSSEDLENSVDHRLVLLLNEAFQSRAKVTKGKDEIKRKKTGAKKIKPGGRKGKRRSGKARRANQAARDKLAQTGGVQDAADSILGLLGDDD